MKSNVHLYILELDQAKVVRCSFSNNNCRLHDDVSSSFRCCSSIDRCSILSRNKPEGTTPIISSPPTVLQYLDWMANYFWVLCFLGFGFRGWLHFEVTFGRFPSIWCISPSQTPSNLINDRFIGRVGVFRSWSKHPELWRTRKICVSRAGWHGGKFTPLGGVTAQWLGVTGGSCLDRKYIFTPYVYPLW